MFSKKDCVIIASVGYLLLIMLNTFIGVNRNSTRELCSYGSACIRFCCRDQETCNTKFLRNNFNADINSHPGSTIENMKDLDYKIMFGEPTCEKNQIKDSNEWKLDRDGEIFIDGYYRTHEEYCFQDSMANNGSVSFDLFVCGYGKDFRFIVNVVEFDSLMYLKYAAAFGFSVSFIFVLSWMTLLNFDVWWTSKKQQEISDGAGRFKFYCFYAFGIVSSMVVIVSADMYFRLRGLIAVAALGIALLNLACDLLFFLMTSIILFRMSRSTNFSNHIWLEVQLERYWINAQLFIILMITSLMKMLAREIDVIPDITISYSALLIFIIFVTKKENQRIFAYNYRQLQTPPLS